KLEAPGILNWAIDGCLEWQQFGLGDPEIVKAAGRSWREESDPFQGFFDDYLTFRPEAVCPSASLFAAVESYEGASGEKVDQRRLTQHLKQKGCVAGRTSSTRYWRGVELKSCHAK